MELKVRKVDSDAKLPIKMTPGSSCYDLSANGHYKFEKGQTQIIGTGLAFEIPKGYEMEARPRSGLASSGMLLLNSPGTIDSDYRGEVFVTLKNVSGRYREINSGDRIVQVKLNKVIPLTFTKAKQINDTVRGEGGYGTTGK